ncbi:hypothetical protein RchiOBHm_Chr6g0281361 [Rosa chinensis]|uniref:Uncharacterized protein n=1 Tax=Rosa chinensis TaxID=74649 RepID=A0A2P6PTH7_ROSCH|nr:hypothetical protein RchiOBHm_Chr6g0281361 [Rosa chinensis]
MLHWTSPPINSGHSNINERLGVHSYILRASTLNLAAWHCGFTMDFICTHRPNELSPLMLCSSPTFIDKNALEL